MICTCLLELSSVPLCVCMSVCVCVCTCGCVCTCFSCICTCVCVCCNDNTRTPFCFYVYCYLAMLQYAVSVHVSFGCIRVCPLSHIGPQHLHVYIYIYVKQMLGVILLDQKDWNVHCMLCSLLVSFPYSQTSPAVLNTSANFKAAVDLYVCTILICVCVGVCACMVCVWLNCLVIASLAICPCTY